MDLAMDGPVKVLLFAIHRGTLVEMQEMFLGVCSIQTKNVKQIVTPQMNEIALEPSI